LSAACSGVRTPGSGTSAGSRPTGSPMTPRRGRQWSGLVGTSLHHHSPCLAQECDERVFESPSDTSPGGIPPGGWPISGPPGHPSRCIRGHRIRARAGVIGSAGATSGSRDEHPRPHSASRYA
jgi:hypothetical protein